MIEIEGITDDEVAEDAAADTEIFNEILAALAYDDPNSLIDMGSGVFVPAHSAFEVLRLGINECKDFGCPADFQLHGCKLSDDLRPYGCRLHGHDLEANRDRR